MDKTGEQGAFSRHIVSPETLRAAVSAACLQHGIFGVAPLRGLQSASICSNAQMIETGDTNPCFGCGAANPRGMHLAFDRDEPRQRIVGRFRIATDFQGGGGFLHGGIIATVLDEAMSKVSRFSGVRTVTAELTVEYLKPIRVDQEILVEGFSARREGRQLYHEGEIRDAEGVLLARGRGRFVIVDPPKYREHAAENSAVRKT